MKLNEPMEFTMTIEDADLEVMAKILGDSAVNIAEKIAKALEDF